MKLNRDFLFKRIVPAAAGALLGFSYYHFIGCRSGSCPITGNPWISTLYGALGGFLISSSSKKKREVPINEDKNGNLR